MLDRIITIILTLIGLGVSIGLVGLLAMWSATI